MEANETTGSLKEIGKSDPLEIGSRIISGIFTPFMVPFLAFSYYSFSPIYASCPSNISWWCWVSCIALPS